VRFPERFAGEPLYWHFVGGYKAAMDKLRRDQHGEIYQDDLTENQSMPRPPRRDDAESVKQYDTGVDSQEADEAMAENRFGQNDKQRDER
jgi:hypothetical protein